MRGHHAVSDKIAWKSVGDEDEWPTGDWNDNGDFNSTDTIEFFGEGGCAAGPRAEVSTVPEPVSAAILLADLLGPALHPQAPTIGHGADNGLDLFTRIARIPGSLAAPRSIKDRGRGLFLMRTYMDVVQYSDVGNQAILEERCIVTSKDNAVVLTWAFCTVSAEDNPPLQ